VVFGVGCEGVFDQVAQGASERVGVAEHDRPSVARELDSRLVCMPRAFGDQRLGDAGEIDGFGPQGFVCLEPGEAEEVVDQVSEAAGFACELRLESVSAGSLRLIS
jgi:hypothetical protein